METVSSEPHLDITVDENELFKGATEIVQCLRPTWPINQLRFKVFTNGITNKLVGVWYLGHYSDMVLIRVYGQKTDLIINRKDELNNIKIMHQAGYTHSLYATFNNGLAYEFVEGDTLTVESVRDPEIYPLVAVRMAEMHRINPNLDREPSIWSKTEQFMRIMPKEFADPDKQSRFEKLVKSYDTLEKEYYFLKERLSRLDSPVVYAHNDLLLGNIIYDKRKKKVTFIDYEYTAYNYQAYDIANHFAEFTGLDVPDYSLYPDEKFQREWLTIYLRAYKNGEDVDEEEVTRVYEQVDKFVLLSHFCWGCWALVQSQHSNIDFEFLEYSAMRFNEYFRRKSKTFD